MPKGFGKNYFTLAAIQACISIQKITALYNCITMLAGKPLKLKINSPPTP
jgi:hypothetical protein